MQSIKETDPVLIEHLLPGGKVYDYHVTIDEFDELDNEGPGHYYGVSTKDQVADTWRAAIAECQEKGIDPLSRRGITLRYRAQHGEKARLPSALHHWLAKRARVAADTAIKEAEEAEAIATWETLFDGLTCVYADKYSGQWWPQAKRGELEVLGTLRVSPRYMGAEDWREARRLPNGDIIVYLSGRSWARWTSDEEIIKDVAFRETIAGHRYAEPLLEALLDLQRAGALRYHCASWFGGPPLRDGNIVRTFGGRNSLTGEEKVQHLREWLTACIECHPKHTESLRKALDLAVAGSVEHVLDTDWKKTVSTA